MMQPAESLTDSFIPSNPLQPGPDNSDRLETGIPPNGVNSQPKSSRQSSLHSNEEETYPIDFSLEPQKMTTFIELFSEDLEEENKNEFDVTNFKNYQKSFEKLSKTMEQNQAKWKKLEETLSRLQEDDESENFLINGRISEVQSMCSTTITPEYILDSLDPEKQKYALSLMIVSRQDFEQTKRENWTYLDVFRYAGRMVHLICRLGRSHVKYQWWKDNETKEQQRLSNGNNKFSMKYSINNSLRRCLITNPRFRSEEIIQQIAVFNQTVEAFTELIPVEMKKELAKYISYETYENNRVIQYQGGTPQKLYYVLNGKIELVYVYKLVLGEVHKSMGFLTHKQMNNLDNVENGVPSATYMVARGQLEVLTLHKEDYINLTNKSNVLLIESFLRQINIFKGLLISESSVHSGMIKIQYFRNDKVITQDSVQDRYFYVVKSGTVVVTRRQGVLSDDISSLLNATNVYSLGCKREGAFTSYVTETQLDFNQSQKTEIISNKYNNTELVKCPIKNMYIKPHTSVGQRTRNKTKETVELQKSRTMLEMTNSRDECQLKSENKRHPRAKIRKTGQKERLTYVKLDSLTCLDIFGLETLEISEKSSNSNLILISEGAEIISINKRYFLQNIDSNTLLEIRKLIKSYVSEEEVKRLISDENKWKAYKKVLMKRMISLHC